MKNVLKWIAIVLGALVGVVALLVLVLHLVGSSRLANAPQVEVAAVTVPTDAAAVERGEHIVHFMGECVGCHGPNLAGNVFIDEAPIGYLAAPNLTSGAGGIGAEMTDEDWVRAIRHGIGRDGRTLAIMPSNWYTYMSDEDLGSVIAYLKSVPPVDNELGERDIMFPGTILFGLMGYGDMPVVKIDHANTDRTRPPEGATAEYGEYIMHISACGDCHGTAYAGLIEANGPPPGPNLTPGGELADWTEEDFITTLRTGITPSGEQLSEEMPWAQYGQMSDTELKAIWAYLHTLPPRELGQNE